MIVASQKVELIDRMGSDLSVVNAARVSFHKFHDVFEEGKDNKLISYLARHGHWTPFAHAFLSFRIKATIFVARQLVKHQVGLVWNEVSRRYVEEEPEFWFEKDYHNRPDNNIKQGSSSEVNVDSAGQLAADRAFCELALNRYNVKLAQGISPEEARETLPLNIMTEWIWSGSVAAWARVCKLRLAKQGVQGATKEVAQMINDAVPKEFEHSWRALLGDIGSSYPKNDTEAKQLLSTGA